MSRIGKNPIQLPDGVSVAIQDALVKVSGPKGQLEVEMHPDVQIAQNENAIALTRNSDSRKHRALHGTMRQLVANAIEGVSQGYAKELEIRGVGFQATVENNRMILQLGYSHDIIFDPPEGITLEAKRTEITVSGIDKQLVGEVAAKIRSFRKPEPYKGKGIRYKDEYVKIKQGKTVGS